MVLLDIDRRQGDDDRLHELACELGPLPLTPCYTTGDGFRLVLAPPGFPLRSEIHGIKVICEKGQVVVPPSIHPETGRSYTWDVELDEAPLAPLPPAWLDKLRDEVRASRPSASRAHGVDSLTMRPPREYVGLLAGIEVGNDRKARCPFDGHEHGDRTPSLHVYETAEQGWFCFGCGRGGGIYQFAALLGGLAAGLLGAILKRPLFGAGVGAAVGWGAHAIWTAPLR